jgi:hypothetical protein
MRQYPEGLQAQIVAEWKAGSSLNSLARGHDIPKSTVQRWVAHHPRVAVIPSTEPKKDLAAYDLDEMALKLVDGSVNAVSRIFGVTEDDAWLKRQNAADLAVLAGVIADKLYRLVGAIQSGQQQPNADA